MNPRGDRPLVIVLAVAAILAPLLTAGATALFFLSRQQDDRIDSLRRDISTLRRANERLFGQLASETAAKNTIDANVADLQVRLDAANRRITRASEQLESAQRALRWQRRATQKARQQAKANGAPPPRGISAIAPYGVSAAFSAPTIRTESVSPPAPRASPTLPPAPPAPAVGIALVRRSGAIEPDGRAPGRAWGRER